MNERDDVMKALAAKAFDSQHAHANFSISAYNECYHLLRNETISEADITAMFAAAQASLWHWTKRDDCMPDIIALAYWQIATVAYRAGLQDTCQFYSRKCRELCEEKQLPAINCGHGYVVSAYASILAKDIKQAAAFIAAAQAQLPKVTATATNEYLESTIIQVQKALNDSQAS